MMNGSVSPMRWFAEQMSVIACMAAVILAFAMLHHIRDQRLSTTIEPLRRRRSMSVRRREPRRTWT